MWLLMNTCIIVSDWCLVESASYCCCKKSVEIRMKWICTETMFTGTTFRNSFWTMLICRFLIDGANLQCGQSEVTLILLLLMFVLTSFFCFFFSSKTWAVILTGEKYILPDAAIYCGVSLRPIIWICFRFCVVFSWTDRVLTQIFFTS